MKPITKGLALFLAFALMLGCLGAAMADGEKYTETTTADGWILVENEGGVTLGYSPDSGVKLLEDGGFAFKDLNKNGQLDAYEDWRLTPDERAAALASLLDFRECLGLMMYSDIFTVESDGSAAYPNMAVNSVYDKLDQGVFSFLSFATSYPAVTLAKWNNNGQAHAESLTYGIPMNVSSNPNSFGAPSGMAFGATFDTDLMNRVYNAKAKMYRAEGIATELGPQIELATDPRWVRAGWTYTEDPALARDLANAAINGYQSTYAEDGTDLGWGQESVVAMMKHYPGDGSSEGGRYNGQGGQYQVYPGDGFMTSLIPFLDGGLNLTGETGSVAALMTSYAISYSDDGAYGDLVHTAASTYKVRLIRDTYGFDGLICTDWNVANDGYGTKTWPKAEVVYREIMNGVDQLGGEVDPDAAVYTEVRQMMEDELGVDGALAHVQDSARRVLRTFFAVGLFDNPYLDTKQATRTVNDEELLAIFDEAWHKSIVMVKNEGNVIRERAEGEKPTVYIPMQYTPSASGYMYATTASWDLPVDLKTAESYFNVVTDTVGEPTGAPVSSSASGESSGGASGDASGEAASEEAAGEPTYTENDIIRASDEEIAACDFCLIFVTATSTGTGWSEQNGALDYVPISLQYRPYTADSDAVRRESISGDTLADGTKENRSYYGKTAAANSYESHLDMILDTAARVDVPVVVCMSTTTAFCVGEFEPEAAAILLSFSDRPTASNTTSFLDIVAGAYEPYGLLPIQMPKDMEAVEAQLEDTPRDMECYVDTEGNVYDFAYGLNWSGLINDARTETYRVPPLTEPSMEPIQ